MAISNLNTYNFIFLMFGPLLRGTPKPVLVAVGKSAPATAAVLVQFPLYGAIAATLIGVKGAQQVAHFFVSLNTQDSVLLTMGIYSAVLGFFIPSGGEMAAGDTPCHTGRQQAEGASRLGGAGL